MTARSNIPLAYYLVMDFGKTGRETIINWEACDKLSILSAVVSGDFSGTLLEVHCIDRNDGTWADVSEDFAREALATAVVLFEEVPSHLRDFIDDKIGAGTVDEAEYRIKIGAD